jgi:hypothetical protein
LRESFLRSIGRDLEDSLFDLLDAAVIGGLHRGLRDIGKLPGREALPRSFLVSLFGGRLSSHHPPNAPLLDPSKRRGA